MSIIKEKYENIKNELIYIGESYSEDSLEKFITDGYISVMNPSYDIPTITDIEDATIAFITMSNIEKFTVKHCPNILFEIEEIGSKIIENCLLSGMNLMYIDDLGMIQNDPEEKIFNEEDIHG